MKNELTTPSKDKKTKNDMKLLYLNKITRYAKSILLIMPLLILSTGCQTAQKANVTLNKWLLEEFGEHHEPSYSSKKFSSNNPKDFIHPDGWATAIPAEADWDLYISPYAPTKLIRSKEEAGTAVLCPFTGKPLVLGDRKKFNDHNPQ